VNLFGGRLYAATAIEKIVRQRMHDFFRELVERIADFEISSPPLGAADARNTLYFPCHERAYRKGCAWWQGLDGQVGIRSRHRQKGGPFTISL